MQRVLSSGERLQRHHSNHVISWSSRYISKRLLKCFSLQLILGVYWGHGWVGRGVTHPNLCSQAQNRLHFLTGITADVVVVVLCSPCRCQCHIKPAALSSSALQLRCYLAFWDLLHLHYRPQWILNVFIWITSSVEVNYTQLCIFSSVKMAVMGSDITSIYFAQCSNSYFWNI